MCLPCDDEYFFFVRIGHTIRSVVCLQVVVAGHIDFVTDVAAGHYGASVTEPESANVCLHFLDILCDVVDLLCEGLDDLLSLIDGMASEHDNDEGVQDGALQATLGLQHRQVGSDACRANSEQRSGCMVVFQ